MDSLEAILDCNWWGHHCQFSLPVWNHSELVPSPYGYIFQSPLRDNLWDANLGDDFHFPQWRLHHSMRLMQPESFSQWIFATTTKLHPVTLWATKWRMYFLETKARFLLPQWTSWQTRQVRNMARISEHSMNTTTCLRPSTELSQRFDCLICVDLIFFDRLKVQRGWETSAYEVSFWCRSASNAFHFFVSTAAVNQKDPFSGRGLEMNDFGRYGNSTVFSRLFVDRSFNQSSVIVKWVTNTSSLIHRSKSTRNFYSVTPTSSNWRHVSTTPSYYATNSDYNPVSKGPSKIIWQDKQYKFLL